MKLFLLLLILALPSPARGTEQPFTVHAAAEGETIASVAERYGASPGDVASANGLSDENRPLAAGVILLVPKSPEEALSTLYEAKRRGLGGWPKPRYQGEFLEPLTAPPSKEEAAHTPPVAVESQEKPDNRRTEAPPAADESGAGGVKTDNAAEGNVYIVREGDNLYRIAKNAGVSLASLMAANGLNEDSIINIGRRLTLPSGGGDPAPRPEAAGLPAGENAPASRAETPAFRIRLPLRAAGKEWKGQGGGIFEPSAPGVPVYAPAAGTVLHGGWMKEFDNAVFIRHEGDFATFCGGLGIIYVKPGQEVTPDTRIGLVGDRASPGVQLNVLKKGRAVDPAQYLE